MKTSELTGAALDWAVAKCEGLAVSDRATRWRAKNCPHLYSTNWAKGGPIIEREWIDLHCVNDSLWEAECPAPGGLAMQNGPTPLVAAMRCYVASKLGDTVEIPDDLVKE
jgi:hypothetical protein